MALQTGEGEHLADARRAALLIPVAQRDVLPGTDHAAADAADADPADIAVVIERRDLQLQRSRLVGCGLWHVRQDRLEQCAHVLAGRSMIGAGAPLQRRGINHGEVQLLVARAELVEQLERLVDHPVGAGPRPVDLVHHHDGLQAERERLARHEAGLRHRAVDRIDHEQHAVDHREHALDFAAEVGVAGGVDDVDAGAVVLDRAVLGDDGDAALTLQIVGIHDALGELFMRGERAGLLQQTVDERRLAVIDVRNDGDVADGLAHEGGGDRNAAR